MRRGALRAFFETLILTSLPVAIGGCRPTCHSTPPSGFTIPNDFVGDGGMPLYLPDGGFIDEPVCEDICNRVAQCHADVDKSGAPVIVCVAASNGCTGRRPEGFELDDAAIGWARMALLEEASVHAFRALAAELVAHDAPGSLVEACLQAANDEVRHTRMMGQLARRAGLALTRAEVRPMPVRDLEAIAVDNAAEGCVRETFGALTASWQGRTERDPVVRRTMAAIAVDETRHAELAWTLDEWIQPRLSSSARARVRRARHAAGAALLDEVEGDRRLHDWARAMQRRLWS